MSLEFRESGNHYSAIKRKAVHITVENKTNNISKTSLSFHFLTCANQQIASVWIYHFLSGNDQNILLVNIIIKSRWNKKGNILLKTKTYIHKKIIQIPRKKYRVQEKIMETTKT